jgi:osmoprotectant transport system permease protein
VGTATIAAAIGAGGLGEYIFRGLSMVDTTTILAGAVPAAALALAADGGLAWIERRLKHGRLTSAGAGRVAGAALVLLGLASGAAYARMDDAAIVVGSKNFTEQVILGELVAQALETEGLQVDRKLNLGGTFVCDRALRSGDLDIYIEYTGTAVTAVFHEQVSNDSQQVFERARELYARSGLTALSPLGFNNTFTILVRGRDARTSGLKAVSDLRSVMESWTPGWYEFSSATMVAGLIQACGLRFGNDPRAMDVSLIYRAWRRADRVTAGDATSALIDAFDLAPLMTSPLLSTMRPCLSHEQRSCSVSLPSIGTRQARGPRVRQRHTELNAPVDIDRRDIKTVVREFLQV